MSGNSGMEELIPIVNKLQNITTKAGFTLKLDLPQIAVVGGQSAGKSSVLENFVGRDFLPRGSGIVTRRPLILQLINNQHEYAEFLHKPGRKFTIPEIRNEIERETNKTIKENKGVSADPINLTIFSPNVLNLTLVDLPGLTKVPVGEQPPDIEDIIREMILQFIRRDNCLILAVTPANSDLANSDALKLAKQVDPKGLRTIGVLTKLDLMDEGTNARDILENKVFPLQRGYIGVVSRSQKDIDEKKDIVNALNAEEQFFLKHPAYSQMAEKLGTSYLQRQLNQQLTIHIRKTLPAFRDELLKRLILVENEIEAYDDFQLNNSSEKTKAMFRMLQQLHSNFETAIGNYNFDNVKGEISIGSKIYRLFHYEFPSNIKKIKTDDKEMEKEIELSIMNARGVRAGLFTPDAAFSGPVKKQIKRFRNPSLKFIICATQEITNISLNCTESILHYPKLRERTEQNITSYIRHCEKKCKELFDTLMDLELAYMNTKHPDFNANINSYQNFTQDTDQNDTIIDTRMVKQVEAIKNCIDSYIKIVKKTMIDLVPKAIQHTVIDAVKNYIESDLLVDLTPNVDQLMVLSEEENCKRDEKLKLYETCKEALRIIDDVSMVCATKIASTTKLSNESS